MTSASADMTGMPHVGYLVLLFKKVETKGVESFTVSDSLVHKLFVTVCLEVPQGWQDYTSLSTLASSNYQENRHQNLMTK